MPPAMSRFDSGWFSIGVTVLIAAIGFAGHTTFQLGQIKGSLDRDLTQLRETSGDHEQRLRRLEGHQVTGMLDTGEAEVTP